MNNVSIIGNLVRDVDLKITGNGMAIASFTVAVKRQFKDKQSGQYESDFISCKAFGKTAEIIANNFSKGKKIAIVGNIQTGSYENSEGKKIFTTDVIVNSITFVESKNQNKAQELPNVNFDAQPVDPFAVSGDELPF